jgi:hypothetical protein
LFLSEEQKNDITSEKSSWDVYRQSGKIKANPVNTWSALLFFVFIFIYAAFSGTDLGSLIEQAKSLAELGTNFSAAILAFIVAGFTIFATLTKPELLTVMASEVHDESGLSYLKFNYLAFMRVFYTYIFFALACVITRICFTEHGVMVFYSRMIFGSHSEFAALYTVRIVLPFIAAYFVFCIMMLRSFIFNVYHSIMTGVRAELE